VASESHLVDRVRSMGVHASSPIDLVAIGFTRREKDVDDAEHMARDLLTRYQGIRPLAEAGGDAIAEMTGLEEFEVLRCLALIELGRRAGGSAKGPITHIDSAQDVADLLEHLRLEKKEHFVAILLDSKNGIMARKLIHVGTLTMSVVGPREVFREAIREGASQLIVAHNHPSGDPTPSPEDYAVTNRLVELGRMLDIPVLDHVIIGEDRFISLQEQGRI